MASTHTTTHQQDAPFIIPGNAFAALLESASARLGHWLRTHRELRRQRKAMRQLRGLSDRTLKDIGVPRSSIPHVVTHNGQNS